MTKQVKGSIERSKSDARNFIELVADRVEHHRALAISCESAADRRAHIRAALNWSTVCHGVARGEVMPL